MSTIIAVLLLPIRVHHLHVPVSLSPQLQLIPSVSGHTDAARQFMDARDFHSAIEHLGEAIEVCPLTCNHVLLLIKLCMDFPMYTAPLGA